MQFGQAFSYQFKDPSWFKKLIIPGLVTLIPVVGQFFILGWALEITRRVINNESDLLPDLNFGANIGKGFQAFIINFVYMIPLIILILPISLVPALGSGVLKLDDNTISTVTMVTSICCGGLALIYGILIGFMLPAAFGNFAAKGGIGSGLKVGEVFGLVKSAPVAYVLVLVGGLAAGIVSSLGSIACGVGVLLTMPYALSMMGNLYGQAYQQATAPK